MRRMLINQQNRNKTFVTSRSASHTLGVHANTLRTWADKGLIESVRIPGGKRRYNVDGYIQRQTNQVELRQNVCYCRVSSIGQKADLERQIEYLRGLYPSHRIIRDVGSGLNYKRKGLQSILDLAMSGSLGQVVVTYRDRLCRFGFELVEHIITQSGGSVMVLNHIESSPQEEMVKDLTSIIHVFSCRLYGLRRYKAELKHVGSKEETPHQEGQAVHSTELSG